MLVFHLLGPAALTVGGCALKLVRLCDILTFLVVLLIFFFPFLLPPLLVDEGKCEAVCAGEAAVGEVMFVLRELPRAAPLLHTAPALGIAEVGLLSSNSIFFAHQ